MMSFEKKKAALIKYFRNNGGFPKGCVTIDSTPGSVGNVSVNGTYYGVFDFNKGYFLEKNDFSPKRAQARL